MHLNKNSLAFTMFLGGLGALPALSIDMNLPALALIATSLRSSSGAATLTLSFFLLGFAVATFISGPLSDRFGRRPILLVGSAVFMIAALSCALAQSMAILWAFRLIQGLGAGTCTVMSMAIVRDLFEGHEARVQLSYVSIVRSIAPMIAPTLGVLILGCANWRFIFAFLAIAGLVLFLVIALTFTESAKHEIEPLTVKSLIANYTKVITNPISCGYAFMNALMFGNIFAYVSNSPLLLIQALNVPQRVFGYIFALTAFGIMAGAFVNGKLNAHKISPTVPLMLGLALSLISSLVIVAVNLTGHTSVILLVPFLFLSIFSMGLAGPNAAHGCMHPLPKIAGIASAFFAFIQMVTGAASSALVAYLYDGHSASAMTNVMLFFSASAFTVYALIIRPAERRTRNEK